MQVMRVGQPDIEADGIELVCARVGKRSPHLADTVFGLASCQFWVNTLYSVLNLTEDPLTPHQPKQLSLREA